MTYFVKDTWGDGIEVTPLTQGEIQVKLSDQSRVFLMYFDRDTLTEFIGAMESALEEASPGPCFDCGI